MLSATAYSFKQKSRLAISLSWVAGYTNAVTFVLCGGIVVAHVTGNVTHWGVALADRAQGHSAAGRQLLFYGFLVCMFLAGAIVSGLLTELARRIGARSHYAVPVVAETFLLLLLTVAADLHTLNVVSLASNGFFIAFSGVAAMTMGLQNATITRISGAVVRTTHLTGVVTDFGLELVQAAGWLVGRARGGPPRRTIRLLQAARRQNSFKRLALLSGIFGSFLFGVVAGTLAVYQLPAVAMAAPLTFLIFLVWMSWRKVVADVEELDPIQSPEVRALLGPDVRQCLPPDVALCRLSNPKLRRLHHPPDLGAWVERLPARWQIIVLIVGPLTHFDEDAAVGLIEAIRSLRRRHRHLLLCGPTPAQLRALRLGGVLRHLGIANVCPDLEMAIARALALHESAAEQSTQY